MTLFDIISIFVSLFISIVAFLSSNNFILTIIVFSLYLLSYFLILRRRIINYDKKIRIAHSCYQFINSFLISLSVKPSLEDAYSNIIKINDKSLQDYVAGIEENDPYERIVYLRKYFNLAVYKIFLNVVDLFQEQGGSILQIGDSLAKETTRIEKDIRESSSSSIRKLSEFILLWVISFGILIFMRFGLSEFYSKMIDSLPFLAMLLGFFVFALVSICLFVFKYTTFEVKEDCE